MAVPSTTLNRDWSVVRFHPLELMPYSREWYLKNKEAVLARHAANKARIRDRLWKLKQELGCE